MPEIQDFEIKEQIEIDHKQREIDRKIAFDAEDERFKDEIAKESNKINLAVKELCDGLKVFLNNGDKTKILDDDIIAGQAGLIEDRISALPLTPDGRKYPTRAKIFKEILKKYIAFLRKYEKIKAECKTLIDEKKRLLLPQQTTDARAHKLAGIASATDAATDSAEKIALDTKIASTNREIDVLMKSSRDLVRQILNEESQTDSGLLSNEDRIRLELAYVIEEANSPAAASAASATAAAASTTAAGVSAATSAAATSPAAFDPDAKAREARYDRKEKLTKKIHSFRDDDESIADTSVLAVLKLAEARFVDGEDYKAVEKEKIKRERGSIGPEESERYRKEAALKLAEQDCYITIPLTIPYLDRHRGQPANHDEFIRAFSEYFGRPAVIVPDDGGDYEIRIQVNDLLQSDKRLDEFLERIKTSREKKVEEATLFPKGFGKLGVAAAAASTLAPIPAGIMGVAGYLIGEGSAKLANLANKDKFTALFLNWFLSPSASLWRGAAEVSCKGFASACNAFGQTGLAEKWKKKAEGIADSEKKRLSFREEGNDVTRFVSVGGAVVLACGAGLIGAVSAPLNYVANASTGFLGALYKASTNKSNSALKRFGAGLGLCFCAIPLAVTTIALKVPAVILTAAADTLSKPAEYLWPDKDSKERSIFSSVRSLVRLNTSAQMRVVEGVDNVGSLFEEKRIAYEKKPAQTADGHIYLVENQLTDIDPNPAAASTSTLGAATSSASPSPAVQPTATLRLSELSHKKTPDFINKLEEIFMDFGKERPPLIDREFFERSDKGEAVVTYTIMMEEEKVEISCPVMVKQAFNSSGEETLMVERAQDAAVATAKIGSKDKKDFLASDNLFTVDDFKIVATVKKIEKKCRDTKVSTSISHNRGIARSV